MRYLSVLLACLVLSYHPTAAAQQRKPFVDVEGLSQLETDEKRLWYESKDFVNAIRKGGQLYDSPAVEAYVQRVMDRLYPEFVGHITVKIINSPVLNAFAIPDGHIYINTGLLTRFENEAQLATVLAHEGAHFIYRHGYYSANSLKAKTGFATITAIIGIPIVSLVTNVLASSSIYGFSRDLEREADRVGFERLKQAGYDLGESHKVFEHLAKEVELSQVKEKVFYSTHPKLKERIASYQKLQIDAPLEGDLFTHQYLAKVQKVKEDDLASELSFGRYEQLISLLSDDQHIQRYPPSAYYYLAEAYRKRNKNDDIAKGIAAVERGIGLDSEYAPFYRVQGLLLMASQDNVAAIKAFEQYLLLEPEAQDRSYIASYLSMLQTQ